MYKKDQGMTSKEIDSSWQVHVGDRDSTVILHVPHSSQLIPVDVRADIVLKDADLSSELLKMTDSHTSFMAHSAASTAALTPWIFTNLLSRLVIDPERFPDDREEMEQVGMGAVYTQTSDGSPLRELNQEKRSHLITQYFEPYAAAFTELVQQRVQTQGRVTIVDVHSYATKPLPYELHATGPRPAICLGTDNFHTSPGLVVQAQRTFQDLGEVGLDSPFVGTYVPLAHYGTDSRVQSIMIEIRRDLYMDETSGLLQQQKAEPLIRALKNFIVAIK
jgi:N-formylglutamate deformylase